jgi:hypothetical protein
MKIPSIKGKNKLETLERISIALIVFGAFILSLGIGLTILTPKGIPAILSMLGALTSFVFTAILIFTWLIKEFKSE